MARMRVSSLLLLSATVLLAPQARGQAVTPTVAVGAVVPRGSLGERYRSGMLVGGGVAFGAPTSSWQFRLMGEYWRLPAASPAPRYALPRPTTLHVLQGLALARVGTRTGRVRPSASLGLGKASAFDRGHRNPYGLVWTAAAGAGVSVALADRRTISLETRLHTILSDYAVEEYTFPTAVPIMIRVEF